MRYLNYWCNKEKTDRSKLKVNDWEVTLSLKKGTLSFSEENRFAGF